MAQSRRPDPVDPREAPAAPAPEDRRTGGRAPVAALVVAAALALQAAALLWLAGDAIAHLGDGVLPAGARVMLIVIYVLLGLWILVTSVALLRGRAWSRGAATAVQLFGVLLSSWLFSVGEPVVGGVLLAVSGIALVTLFSRPVTAHLSQAAREPSAE